MKVYLDDERTPPDGWILVKTPAECIELLQTGEVEELSLDHDLGIIDTQQGEETGYDVLLWMEKMIVLYYFVPPATIIIHTANSAARSRMIAALETIRRLEKLYVNNKQ